MRRSVVYIGLISYPLYLWHWPLFSYLHQVQWGEVTTAMIIATLVLSFILAVLTYKYIELPLRQSRRRGPQLVIMLCFGMIACGTVGWLMFIGKVPARSLSNDVSKYVRAINDPWPDSYTSKRNVDGFYTFGTGQKRVLFIGDSTVGHYIPRIAKVVAENPNSYSAVLVLAGGCSVAFEMAFVDPEGCKKVMEYALRYSRNPDVEAIVIGSSWYLQFVGFSDWEADRQARPAEDRDEQRFAKDRKHDGRLGRSGKAGVPPSSQPS